MDKKVLTIVILVVSSLVYFYTIHKPIVYSEHKQGKDVVYVKYITEEYKPKSKKAYIKMGYTEKDAEEVSQGRVCVGMPEAYLYEAWGKPAEISQTGKKNSNSKKAAYGRSPKFSYVYIEDGIITSIRPK